MIPSVVIVFEKDIDAQEIQIIRDYLGVEDTKIEDNRLIINDINLNKNELSAFKEMIEADMGKRFRLFYLNLYNREIIDDFIQLHNLGIINSNLIIQADYLPEYQLYKSDNLDLILHSLNLDFSLFKDADLDFIINLYRNNGNVARVARSEYMHRNSVIYQIDRLSKMSGLNLKEFMNLRRLYLCALIIKMKKI